MTAERRTDAEGMILTVGGTYEPIQVALKETRPSFVLFVVSPGSKSQVDIVLSAFSHDPPQWETLTVSDHQDLGRCYAEIRCGIADWLLRRALEDNRVAVDITGGTKPMSAALALVAIERLSNFRYVGGTERDASGLGVVVSGSERIVGCRNPWDKYAVRETERAGGLLKEHYADAASRSLTQAAKKCDTRVRALLLPLGQFVAALAHADRFDFKTAITLYGRHERRAVLAVTRDRGTFLKAEAMFAHWCTVREQTKHSGKTPGRETILELIANADRRAEQSRFDDATGRLYRAVELHAQRLLRDHFGAELGKLAIESIPNRRRSDFQSEFGKGDNGVYQFGIRHLFRALDFSPHELSPEQRGTYQRLEKHLQVRNTSLFAHGAIPVTEEKYLRFRESVGTELAVSDDEVPRWPELTTALTEIIAFRA